ncbi:Nin-like protein 1 [Quillaja saponaria]|uniref:Nin-like protein 1 n=1 Tax=Quillaja saponaria TaxID=32244 RepID=A0AAD7PJK9_QUISA|nr:Nin-like protein 1 [Quillaja saponaria]
MVQGKSLPSRTFSLKSHCNANPEAGFLARLSESDIKSAEVVNWRAVDLRSSDVLSTQYVNVHKKSYQTALLEIQEVLRSACETHKLQLLAQTWVPCVQHGKDGCQHSDGNYFQCDSTVDCACCL